MRITAPRYEYRPTDDGQGKRSVQVGTRSADIVIEINEAKLIERKGRAALFSKNHRTTLADGAIVIRATNVEDNHGAPTMTRDLRIEYPSSGATYDRDEYGVYEYTTFPRSSVLAGQQRRQFLASFPTLDAARAAYPDADVSGCGYQPPFLGHLPDEADDRDDSPIEMTERTTERWDFEADPDWR